MINKQLFPSALAVVASACTSLQIADTRTSGTSNAARAEIAVLEGQLSEKAKVWRSDARVAVANRATENARSTRAKNIILFIGDGMDPTTVTAARIYAGQQAGRDGESNTLSFEEFPNLALAKTYTTDFQVPDSAGTATAMLTGVKTRSGVLGVSEEVETGNCASGLATKIPTIGEYAEIYGLSTGVVSTAALTHATPASLYAHTASRDWGADSNIPEDQRADGCVDIAKQLIDFPYGDGIDVAMGGGRAHFTAKSKSDPESDQMGARTDNVDLAAVWASKSDDHVAVTNLADMRAAANSAKLLGLFEHGHMKYELDRKNDKAGEPSLAEMTEKAISILSNDEDGFFLLVEAGRIDHAHHAGNAKRALHDTVALADAVTIARTMTSEKDTLIIVTADHGHTLSIQGYPARANDILDIVKVREDDGTLAPLRARGDGQNYTTLSYANGPGAQFEKSSDQNRPNVTSADALGDDYKQQALIATGSETHGGQDVPVYASGPGAHLVSGVMEQNVIFQIMMDAYGW